MRVLRSALLGLALIVAGWGLLLAGTLNGWWRSAIAPAGDADAFLSAAGALLDDGNRGAAALLLIEDCRVIGSRFASVADTVDQDTLFPLASASKWVAATAVMRLVEDGRVGLDDPVADHVTRWSLPSGAFDPREVTVARLLSHTAGLTDGLGFGDYLPDQPVPPLVESLQRPRGSSGDGAIVVGQPPGDGWAYSGGGYLLLELLVEEVSGLPFGDYVAREVFQPLGMQRSTYRYLGEVSNAAPNYHPDGRPAPWYRYASRAATALSSSAADLARFARAQMSCESSPRVLEPGTIDAMRGVHAELFGAPFWGLGVVLYAPTAEGPWVFGHDGSNEPAINASIRVNADRGDAMVALATGNPSLASTLGFHWTFWQTGKPDPFGTMADLTGGWWVALLWAMPVVTAGIWLHRRVTVRARTTSGTG